MGLDLKSSGEGEGSHHTINLRPYNTTEQQLHQKQKMSLDRIILLTTITITITNTDTMRMKQRFKSKRCSTLLLVAVVLVWTVLLSSSTTDASPLPSASQISTHRAPFTSLTNKDNLRGGGAMGHSKSKKPKIVKRKKSPTDDDSGDGRATIVSSVFNLVNNVAGAGILTLSSGMATGTGWIPAMLICAVLGLLSGHCFSMVGEACELLQEQDFKGLWKTTIGADSAYVVDAIIAVMCLACAIIYSGILGDVFTPLLAQAGFPAQWNGRTSNIIAITISLLLPLSLIKDLSALAFTSILGFAAIIYTVMFIIIRSLDGSYKLPSGRFLQEGAIAAMPAFKKTSLWNFDFTSLVLASNLGLAYIAHYNAPNFYRSLKNTNSSRFRIMVNIAFTMLVLLYIATMIAGYSTFGDVCQGNILLNYHPDDILSTLGRLATGFSILFGFPLVACGAREAIIGVASSLGYEAIGSSKNHFLLVLGILAFVTAISCTVKDVSLVVGLTGAALGSFIVYMCPPVIFSKAVAMTKGTDSLVAKQAKKNLTLVPFGLCIACLGCFMTIKESMSK